MDERLVKLIQDFIPGAEIAKLYKGDGGEVKVDIKLPDGSELTCSLKKNHAGEVYLD